MDCTCGHKNRPGTLYCEECGNSLSGNGKAGATKVVTTPLGDDASRLNLGSALAHQDIIFKFGDGRTLVFDLEETVVVGRADDDSGVYPDLDLNPFGALPKGVSRRHAQIERQDNALIITDLRSSNGTYLNGQRLQSGNPRVLRDGDELSFGKLVVKVSFTVSDATPIVKPSDWPALKPAQSVSG